MKTADKHESKCHSLVVMIYCVCKDGEMKKDLRFLISDYCTVRYLDYNETLLIMSSHRSNFRYTK